MKKGILGARIYQEVQSVLQDPDDYEGLLLKLKGEIDLKKGNIEKLEQSIKTLTLSNWLYKLSRRKSQDINPLAQPQRQNMNDQLPVSYLLVLTFGILLLLLSILRGITRDPNFNTL